jgi:hypothetical protein
MQNEEFEEIDDSLDNEVTREDKIFNNRYNSGDGLMDPDDYAFNARLNISNDYSSSFLKDIYEVEYQMEYSNSIDSIFDFFNNDPEISKMITVNSTGSKNKFAKEEINFIFNKAYSQLSSVEEDSHYFSPIYIVEAISAISSMEYKKIFDSLETDIQEILIIELNKKYNFLEGRFTKKRMH